MGKYFGRELPIRAKIEMAADVAKIIRYLHQGRWEEADLLILDLKSRSIHMDEEVQQDVLLFAEQIHFHYDYDPWHKVTLDVGQAADRLIKALGFTREN